MSIQLAETPNNLALQRTAPGVTAHALATCAPAAFLHELRRPPQSLTLRSFAKEMKTLLAIAICVVTSGFSAGVPLPPIKEKAIEGTVVGFVWMSEMQHEEAGVWNRGYTSEWAALYFNL